MTSSPADGEGPAENDLRQGTADRYRIVRLLGGTGETLLVHEVTGASDGPSMVLLEVDPKTVAGGFDPSTTLPMPTALEKTVVTPAHDQGAHEGRPFMVYETGEALPICFNTLYLGWDPYRIELLGRLVETLRAARDARIDVICCAYETLVTVPRRQVRFLSPVRTVPPDETIDFEARYFLALQQMVRKLVRNVFSTTPPSEELLVANAPENADTLMWSAQFHASPELRQVLDDLVSSRIDSLDEAARQIDAFGAGHIVRKRTGWGTHRGMVREGNEDALMLLQQAVVAGNRPLRVELYAVADGMGGHEAGEIASEITLKSMAVELVGGLNITSARDLGRDLLDHEFLSRRMSEAIERANQTVRQYAWDAHAKSRRKPGSTLVCALAIDAVLTIGHVGDSRAYKIGHDGSLERITRDHSPVQALVDSKRLTPEQAFKHPQRHQISSNIGITPENLRHDVNIRLLRIGEAVLLCSDGLSDMMLDTELEAYCKQERDPRRLARVLVDAACERGGNDNVTVLVIMRAPGPPQEERDTSAKFDGREAADEQRTEDAPERAPAD